MLQGQECEQPHLVSPGSSEGEMKEGGVRVTAALACDNQGIGAGGIWSVLWLLPLRTRKREILSHFMTAAFLAP